jgi:hypothetical protein
MVISLCSMDDFLLRFMLASGFCVGHVLIVISFMFDICIIVAFFDYFLTFCLKNRNTGVDRNGLIVIVIDASVS